jgi:hypothetical protein
MLFQNLSKVDDFLKRSRLLNHPDAITLLTSSLHRSLYCIKNEVEYILYELKHKFQVVCPRSTQVVENVIVNFASALICRLLESFNLDDSSFHNESGPRPIYLNII